MATFRMVTSLSDFGPWVSCLLLDMPCEVLGSELNEKTFSVHCARLEADGSPVMRRERGAEKAHPTVGYPRIRKVYPVDEMGQQCFSSKTVAVELCEERLAKRIEGAIERSRYVRHEFCVTQLHPLSCGDEQLTGLVFTVCREELCPERAGWHEEAMHTSVDGISLAYALYDPRSANDSQHIQDEKLPLILWLHGAGEGGDELWRAVEGNRVTALSQEPIQSYFGGRAWVVVPQSPTYWMDDGVEQLSRSNKSIYTKPLRALLNEVIEQHGEAIDTSRIVVGGLSNGGFMTVRLCIDYPETFAAGIAVCAPFYEENQTPEVVAALSKTPLWFVHAAGDELVDPRETSLPIYRSLREAGATVHFTWFTKVEDLTGAYRDAQGRPLRIFNHGVWIHAYNDFCHTDLDGSAVILDGVPVGMWEWAGYQRRS